MNKWYFHKQRRATRTREGPQHPLYRIERDHTYIKERDRAETGTRDIQEYKTPTFEV